MDLPSLSRASAIALLSCLMLPPLARAEQKPTAAADICHDISSAVRGDERSGSLQVGDETLSCTKGVNSWICLAKSSQACDDVSSADEGDKLSRAYNGMLQAVQACPDIGSAHVFDYRDQPNAKVSRVTIGQRFVVDISETDLKVFVALRATEKSEADKKCFTVQIALEVGDATSFIPYGAAKP